MRSCKPLANVLLCFALASPLAMAQNAKAGRFYEDALKRYQAQDLDGATVQLKNALQEDRKFLPALMLLGRASLENSSPGAAEGAFLAALDLGANRSEVAVPLAQAFVAQGKHALMLSEPRLQPSGLPPAVQSRLLLVRAAAQVDLGDERGATASIAQARQLSPEQPDVWLAEVPMRLRNQQLDAALVAINEALKLAPNNVDAIYQRASVSHLRNALDDALRDYNAVLARDPHHLDALLARAGIALDRGQADAAQADIQRIQQRYPKDPRAEYLSALVAERRGDRKAAQAALRRVTALIDVVPIEFIRYRPQIVMLGGLAHHGLNEPEKARPYLETVVRQQPRNPVSKLLAQVLFSVGEVENGIQLLETYLRLQPQDAQAIALLAAGHSAVGRNAKATQLMTQALNTRDSPELRGVLGQALMRAGRFEPAQAELENAWKRNPANTATGTNLAMLYLRTNQPARAVEVARKLSTQAPDQASLQHLLGMSLAANRDAKGARAAFEQALKLEPNLPSAHMSLARLEANAGQFPAAQKRLQALHERDPVQVEPMLELAALARRQRQFDSAERWLERAALIAGPRELRPHFAQVELLLDLNRPDKAAAAGKALLGKAPDDAAALQAYGRALVANGDFGVAKTILAQASRRQAFDAPAFTTIAGLQLQARDLPGAAYTLGKVLEAEPRNPRALLLQGTVAIQQGELGAAAKHVNLLLQVQPRASTSHLLAAELAMANKQPAAALSALRKAHEVEPTTATTVRLMLHLAEFDKGNGAQATAEAWLARVPQDVAVRRALAEHLAARKQWPAAKGVYEQLLRLSPNDPAALNNIALVHIQLGDLPAARANAEKALRAAPDQPLVMDTLAWALHLSGQHSKALSLLRDARLRAPDHAEIRYHLAAVLAKLGQSAEARLEVQAALANPTGLESAKEAQALLAALK